MRSFFITFAAFYIFIVSGVAFGDASFGVATSGDASVRPCQDKEAIQTQLNFEESILKENGLKDGGQLRFGNIGEVRGNFVDLVVTASEYEIGYNTPGLNGKFGQVGLNTKKDQLSSGRGVFKFCLVEPDTNTPVTADSFQWTIFDLDRRKNTNGKRGIHEKMLMDTSQVSHFFLYPNESESTVKQSCEDGQPLPCAAGVRTVFEATQDGTTSDNPSDPNNLTELQKKRSIAFTFRDTSCWTIVYDAYCPFELETPKRYCSWYGGSNFFFAGQQDQLNDEGECITSAPTVAPVPTVSPTAAPTVSPTTAPTTVSPTAVPTVSPTAVPTASPTAAPTVSPTAAPTVSPTAAPTVSPTAAPTVSPTAAPTTVSPTAAPTTVSPTLPPTTVSPTAAPTVSPTDVPTVSPTAAPTASPTLPPTTVSPTTAPTASPTQEPTYDTTVIEDANGAGCSGDIELLAIDGNPNYLGGGLNIRNATKIVAQDGATVKVNLIEAWASANVDAYYYEYSPSVFDQKCYAKDETQLMGPGSLIDTITINCSELSKTATLKICLEGVTGEFVDADDNASVPKCCHSTAPEGTPTVCYAVVIDCTGSCLPKAGPQTALRRLRGSAKN